VQIAAQVAPLRVLPGIGVGNLKLGMTIAQTKAVLKADLVWLDYMSEMKDYKSFTKKFSIDSLLEFILGFDSVARFAADAKRNLPVWTLYFKNGKLHIIGISSYLGDNEMAKKLQLSNGIKMWDLEPKDTKLMNAVFIQPQYAEYTAVNIYYTKGIELTYDENRLRFMSIFPKSPDLLNTIKNRKPVLIKEFNTITNEMLKHPEPE
jgi:hypothetical protein